MAEGIKRIDLSAEDRFIDEATRNQSIFSGEVAESTSQTIPAFSTKGKKRYQERVKRSQEDDNWLGGFDTKNLDRKFYRIWIKEAQDMGIDPYFYVAHTIKELGGVRDKEWSQKKFQINPESTIGPLIAEHATFTGWHGMEDEDVQSAFKYTGREAVEEGKGGYGAGATLIADPVGQSIDAVGLYNNLLEKEDLERIRNFDSKNTEDDIYNPNTALNKASMFTLKRLYNRDLKSLSEGASAEVFQRTNPGEKDYGKHMNTIYQGLKTSPDYKWIREIIDDV